MRAEDGTISRQPSSPGQASLRMGINPMAVRLRKFVIIYDGLKSLDLNDGKSQITNYKLQINSNDSNSKKQTRIDPQIL